MKQFNMNERVEKFARECGAWNQMYGNRTFMLDEHFDIEKFAELIVKECINRINDLKGYTGLNDSQQIVSTACWNTALNSSVHEIKKHFGVNT